MKIKPSDYGITFEQDEKELLFHGKKFQPVRESADYHGWPNEYVSRTVPAPSFVRRSYEDWKLILWPCTYILDDVGDYLESITILDVETVEWTILTLK